MLGKASGLVEVDEGSAEDQLTGPEGLVESLKEQAAEQAGQHADRQEETGPAGHPALAIGRQPAAGDDAVQVGMVLQGLAPGVQHRDDADLGAEVTRVGRNGAQRRGRAAEQDVVDDALVLQWERQKPGALRRESDCVLAEASVQHRRPDLKHAVGTSGRPAHLPSLVHAGTHQLIDGALGP